ncbi:AAA family ATPase [Flavobacteriaceae bacterium XHP0103]|uniref:ATP-dependent nuclease n=1 Tax=Marixanthotalea marina TaxID=2844359 RepID=UPI002989DF68|nr:AAA family ATPase [Marixanthotalea marina]MBU3822528.1 AAA family ATPase [Marixanthotalea marina]
MRLQRLKINTRFKNLEDFEIDFSNKEGITVLIGNNGSGKSNILEAISSVFAGLYNNSRNPSFEYELSYTKDTYNIEVKFEGGSYETKVNGVVTALRPEHLPNQLIASYSGEESRLWDKYYWPFYRDYIAAIKGATVPDSELIFINKFYWNIALLVLHFYDFEAFTDIRDFCKDTLGIDAINSITFDFDIPKLNTWSANPVKNMVQTLNPANEASITITLEEFKNRLNFINEIDLFKYLAAAFMPKDDKVITKIEIYYNTGLKAESLSEGEKKLLLIMLILEVIGDENSLILLDEPDSHIHLSNKEQIEKLLKAYSNRENILTTHSPTLTHNFDLKHITMLSKKVNNDAQVEEMEKQKIVYELTKGIWSYQEQNIFLNSKKDILLVEGKYDKIYITEALKRLKRYKKYQKLDFEYLPMGGAEGLENFIDKFTPKKGQKIIALLDRDSDGKKPIETVLKKKVDINTFDFEKSKKIFLALYPKTKGWKTSNFVVEDYFKRKIFADKAIELIKKADETFKMFPNKIKEKVKEAIPQECQKPTFADKEFNGFKILFDKLIEIKKVR